MNKYKKQITHENLYTTACAHSQAQGTDDHYGGIKNDDINPLVKKRLHFKDKKLQ